LHHRDRSISVTRHQTRRREKPSCPRAQRRLVGRLDCLREVVSCLWRSEAELGPGQLDEQLCSQSRGRGFRERTLQPCDRGGGRTSRERVACDPPKELDSTRVTDPRRGRILRRDALLGRASRREKVTSARVQARTLVRTDIGVHRLAHNRVCELEWLARLGRSENGKGDEKVGRGDRVLLRELAELTGLRQYCALAENGDRPYKRGTGGRAPRQPEEHRLCDRRGTDVVHSRRVERVGRKVESSRFA
jgi:hypothetical protein